MPNSIRKVVFIDDKLMNLDHMLVAAMNIAATCYDELNLSEPFEIYFLHVKWGATPKKYDKLYSDTVEKLSKKIAGEHKRKVSLKAYHSCSLPCVTGEDEYLDNVDEWSNAIQDEIEELIGDSEKYAILLDVSLYHDYALEAKVFRKNARRTLSFLIRQMHESQCLSYTHYQSGPIVNIWRANTECVVYDRETDLKDHLSLDLKKGILSCLGE